MAQGAQVARVLLLIPPVLLPIPGHQIQAEPEAPQILLRLPVLAAAAVRVAHTELEALLETSGMPLVMAARVVADQIAARGRVPLLALAVPRAAMAVEG